MIDNNSEWSDSSYILRKKHRMYWSAIIRNVPDEIKSTIKLEDMFSKWSVSLGFSLPSSIIISEELCIIKGFTKVIIVCFPSRSSTRSFTKLSKKYIWNEISKESSCELYVYCDPPLKFKPFINIPLIDTSTCYWLIRDISKEIIDEEAFWDYIGRRNPFGKFLKRIVYIKDEKSKGFCFLQFSSPLTSYRALKWQTKETDNSVYLNKNQPIEKKIYSKPIFVGSAHIQALLKFLEKFDKYEIKTLEKLKNLLFNKKVFEPKLMNILSNYLSFWTKTYTIYTPIDRNFEFQSQKEKNFEINFINKLNDHREFYKFIQNTKLYHNKSLNITWDWNSRIFVDIQNNLIFEFDLESSNFVLMSSKSIINNKEFLNQDQTKSKINETLDTPEQKFNSNNVQNLLINEKKQSEDKQILIASILETTKSQLNYTNNNFLNLNNSQKLTESSKISENVNKRKITEIFDKSTNDFSNCINIKKVNSVLDCKFQEKNQKLDDIYKNITLDEPNNESLVTLETKCHHSDSNIKKQVNPEDLICFVCCREFEKLKEKINHEQNSLLHKFNLENIDKF